MKHSSISARSWLAASALVVSCIWIAHGRAAALDPSWLETDSVQCGVLCRQSNMLPVTTGKHPDGSAYYVCAVEIGKEGWRVGYQVSTSRTNDCIAGYDGREISSATPDSKHDAKLLSPHTRCLCY
jgi:hypothetical protein